MSELINNSEKRKELLKHMILQLHEGKAPEEIRERLVVLMQKIPYGEVVEVEQDLIAKGILTDKEILQFCDLHSKALEGNIDLKDAKLAADGHPVDVFIMENGEIKKLIALIRQKITDFLESSDKVNMLELTAHFNSLMDIDKHYKRKEYLLFPFLEKKGITGPPTVMWGKDDEIRELVKASIEALKNSESPDREELEGMNELLFIPALNGVEDMIMKEEEILLPMSMDKLNDHEWYEISKQTLEFGFCLYDPQVEWKPEGIVVNDEEAETGDMIRLPSGNISKEELLAILNTLPVDMTFVDKNDKVRYFSQGTERIFARNRAILNRDVRLCHPPSSVGIVEQIISDFKSGKETHAPFWIQMRDKFIHIEYFALRNPEGEYLGTLEVSQDLSAKRQLQGEQRILSYAKNE